MLNVTDEIFRAIDKGETAVMVLLDYTKAFNQINHEILVSILHYLGFSDGATLLLSNYLADRRQYVETNKGKSEILYIDSGVPQGSILGPLLYSMYTCNISQYIEYSMSQLYADDTQLVMSFNPDKSADASKFLNTDLESLSKFSEAHLLNINPSKSCFMVFGKHNKTISVDFELK